MVNVNRNKLLKQKEVEKNLWYFKNSVQSDTNYLNEESRRRDIIKKKERQNMDFLCLQMKERRKETFKHKGHMKLRVKIDDDYRSSKRIQSRNKALQQALRGFSHEGKIIEERL
mmetsp:Transcript_22047/g.19610  ORF Transcript_22047/g.19610 Transcript_22047/m.19610 type:complete len:114 (-) Transcript_22047:27-368(-)